MPHRDRDGRRLEAGADGIKCRTGSRDSRRIEAGERGGHPLRQGGASALRRRWEAAVRARRDGVRGPSLVAARRHVAHWPALMTQSIAAGSRRGSMTCRIVSATRYVLPAMRNTVR